MSDLPPVIICEPPAVETAAKVAQGYVVEAPSADLTHYSGRKVILWPDATLESRESFRKLADQLSSLCSEIKIILPNGRPAGWNIAVGVQEGMTWPQLAAWAKSCMIAYEPVQVEVHEAADPVPANVEAIWDQVGIARTERGPYNNADNVVRMLTNWEPFKNLVWFDEFYGRYFTGQTPREWKDIDDTNLMILLQNKFGFPRISEEAIAAGVRCRGQQCIRNEPKEWLRSRRWDGKRRIGSFFVEYMGGDSNAYIYAVSHNFWVGMVARVYQPGCQLDNMFILEGKQGIYKSKALEAIGGKWFMEASEEITSKDFFVALQGKFLVEVADLDSFSRADTNRIKKVITCRTDRYRAPYGRASEDHPRQCVFVGTTNEQHYLRDSTGARRFWPLQCGRIDIDAIKRDREQLFAEAVQCYLDNEGWYLVPSEETLSQQENRRQYDEWENLVSTFLVQMNRKELVLSEIATHVGIDKGHLDIAIQRRLGAILRRLGWESKTAWRDGATQRLWMPKSVESQSPSGPASSEIPATV